MSEPGRKKGADKSAGGAQGYISVWDLDDVFQSRGPGVSMPDDGGKDAETCRVVREKRKMADQIHYYYYCYYLALLTFTSYCYEKFEML